MTVMVLCLLVLVSGCAFSQAQSAVRPSTPTTVRVVQTTPVPTVNRSLQAIPTARPVTDEPPTSTLVPSCAFNAGQLSASHRAAAILDYRRQTVDVQQTVQYLNLSGDALSRLVFDVEPNRIPGALTMNTITVGQDTPVPVFELAGRRLTVDLADPLAPGCQVTLRFDYHLKIPQIGEGDNGLAGYFGFGARQINLAHWLIAPAPRMNGDWLLHDGLAVGEQTVLDPGDWNVTITVNGASEQLQVVGPGTAVQSAPTTWHFVLDGAREFTLSMSERFNRSTQVAENGVTVELYTFDDTLVETASGEVDAAVQALNVATRSIGMYSDLFGDYPHSRFILVEGDFPDGMEFSDFVFVGGEYFRSYPGQPTSYLTIITAHEVAHQWWYARVGSDQALMPWLDEALAAYSEYIFYEEYYPELKDWWWEYRVHSFIPNDFRDRSVASTVYDFTFNREYINNVYLQGALMMRDLRQDLGTQAFFDWLRRYAEVGAGNIVTPDLLWSLLTPAQLEATWATRQRYLGDQAGPAPSQ